MDKVVAELLSPFTKRLGRTATASALLFWFCGVLLFHLLHPQPLPGCPSGGADLCGLLSADWRRGVKPGLAVFIAMALSMVLVFSRSSEATQLLSGTGWTARCRKPGIRLQRRARSRCVNRAYGTTSSPRAQWRVQRFPQGSQHEPMDDEPRLSDVLLEPTCLGNVFAAARQRVLARHGLRLHSCWSYLLAVLPAPARAELERHSTDVLTRTQAVLWSLAATSFAALLPGTWWKTGWVLASLIAAYLAYRQVCTTAASYCDALEGIIVAHRKTLYEAAGFDPPTSTLDEPKKGKELSGYLDRHGPPERMRIGWITSTD